MIDAVDTYMVQAAPLLRAGWTVERDDEEERVLYVFGGYPAVSVKYSTIMEDDGPPPDMAAKVHAELAMVELEEGVKSRGGPLL